MRERHLERNVELAGLRLVHVEIPRRRIAVVLLYRLSELAKRRPCLQEPSHVLRSKVRELYHHALYVGYNVGYSYNISM